MSFLEVDESSLENRLILNKDENTDNMNSLLNEIVGNPTVPTKLITPIPGICVKAFTSTGDKVFINICHTEEIPPPKKNTIPMSIGNEKEIPDKHGKSCIAFDVALNSTFFNAHQNELVILTIIEGISNKHGLNFQENKYHILRNVKCKGKIGPMNIEQRPVKPDPQKKTLISEIKSKPETKVIPIDKAAPVPDFNLIKVDSPRKFYGSEIDLKNVISKDDISLQIGEDRIFLTTQGTTKYELEYHFPQLVNTDLCTSEFDPIAQVLTIVAPLKN